MKFISKSANLLIVLSPGLQAQPLTGTPAKPTVSVRFKDGVVEVPEEGGLIEMMLRHPGFNSDFISADITGIDPYLGSRKEAEPTHVVTEMKFGTPINRKVEGGDKASLTPELRKLINDMAIEMAKKMLPTMVESTLKNLVQSHKDEIKVSPIPAADKPKGKRGRPKKNITKSIVETSVITETPLAQVDAV